MPLIVNTPEKRAALTFSDAHRSVLSLGLGNIDVLEDRKGDRHATRWLTNPYSRFADDLALCARTTLNCTTLVQTSPTLAGKVEDRIPNPSTLRSDCFVLQASCHTKKGLPGGKDYGGKENVSWTGRHRVPWKDVRLLDLDYSCIEGNCCR